MTSRALIGHSGFVGGNLLAQQPFDALFNSKNIEELAGRSFDLLVCAGAPAVKWLANREPERDRETIERLARALETVHSRRVILISTIDVYPRLDGADERYECAAHDNHAYGKHRLWLEQRVRARFPHALIARLPAVFGPGLKKNVLFDLMHGNQLAQIQPASHFQWYDVRRLSEHLARAESHGLKVINLFTEPVATGEIAARFFPSRQVGESAGQPVHYDLRTMHCALFAGERGYVSTRAQVLADMASFLDTQGRSSS